MNIPTDESIIEEIRSTGDFARFTALYDAYSGKIYRYVFYRTHHKETSEDIASDVFMKALNGLDSFDASKGTFSSWIYRIARNSLIDLYRSRKQTVGIEEIANDVKFSSGDDPTRDAAETKESIRKALDVLSTLSEDQREIVLLRAWDGLPYKEIADILGKSEASCKMGFSRATARLRGGVLATIAAILLMQ